MITQDFATAGVGRHKEFLHRYTALTKKMTGEERQATAACPVLDGIDEQLQTTAPAYELPTRDAQFMLHFAQHLKRTRDFACAQLFRQLVRD